MCTLNLNWMRMIPIVITFMLLSSCGSDSSSSQQQSYKDTKTIVLDILKTEDAQKAFHEASQKNPDQTMKLLSTGEGQQIQVAVKDILTDPSNSKLLEKTMKDPKFAGDFAKAVQKSDKQLHKDLMKDPEYQKLMVETMNNPEFEKMMLGIMKNSQYRQQTMNVMQESLQSPLFRTQLMELIKKVVEEETKPKPEEKQGGGGGGDQKQGDQKDKSK
jgi:spore germination protein D